MILEGRLLDRAKIKEYYFGHLARHSKIKNFATSFRAWAVNITYIWL